MAVIQTLKKAVAMQTLEKVVWTKPCKKSSFYTTQEKVVVTQTLKTVFVT